MRDLLARLPRYLRRHGVRPTLWRVRDKLVALVYLHEVHVWSTLGLAEDRPRPALPPGYVMHRAGVAELPELEDLGVDPAQSRKRLATGAELWVIRHDDRLVYSGWVFHGYVPTVAAASGAVPLPAGMANPEDMVTAPEHRGRGLASAAYALIFDDLARDGRASTIIGKVPEDNRANRRALEKSGWREFAVVDFRRLGWRRRATVRPVPGGGDDERARADWLAGALRSS